MEKGTCEGSIQNYNLMIAEEPRLPASPLWWYSFHPVRIGLPNPRESEVQHFLAPPVRPIIGSGGREDLIPVSRGVFDRVKPVINETFSLPPYVENDTFKGPRRRKRTLTGRWRR